MSNEEIMKVVKPAVCGQLKSPSSAQFPVDLISIVGDDERGYHIEGFVDSQNSYGAMIRNDFKADVKLENGFPKVENVMVGMKAAAKGALNFGVNWIALMVLCGVLGMIMYSCQMAALGL